MALYMVHHTYDGEPVGIHGEAGDAYYVPGFENLERSGTSWMGRRVKSFPWSDFVEIHTDRFTHRDWWSSLESPLTKEQALDELRGKYTDARAAE